MDHFLNSRWYSHPEKCPNRQYSTYICMFRPRNAVEQALFPAWQLLNLHLWPSQTMNRRNRLQDFNSTCNMINCYDLCYQGSLDMSTIWCLERLASLKAGSIFPQGRTSTLLTSAFWWQAELQAAARLQAGSLQTAQVHIHKVAHFTKPKNEPLQSFANFQDIQDDMY